MRELGLGSLPLDLALLTGAVAMDRLVGELPAAVHPVVWMGRASRALLRLAPRGGHLAQLLFGAVVALGIPAAFAAGAALVLSALAPWPVAVLLAGVPLLKSTFAVRALGDAARCVRDALGRDDLPGARHGLRSLCSRDPAGLDDRALVAGTVESVAENASDSIVAPLFYYALAGLPGAMFYRAVNTLDAMIGYRGRTEWLGKAAARLDDLLNLVPARLTAGLLLVAGWLHRHDARRGLRILRRDGRRTESPNAGRPMAAMAGLLGVELAKPGCYRLGDPGAPLTRATIDQAWRIAGLAAVLATAAAAAYLGVSHARTG